MDTATRTTVTLFESQGQDTWVKLHEAVGANPPPLLVTARPAVTVTRTRGKAMSAAAKRRIKARMAAQRNRNTAAMHAVHASAVGQQALERHFGVPVTVLVGLPEVSGDTWRVLAANGVFTR